MTPEQISALAGSLLSLVFSYVPGLAPKFDALDPTQKRLTMAVAIVVTSAIVYLYSHRDNLQAAFTLEALPGLIGPIVFALAANQGTYLLTPKPPAV